MCRRHSEAWAALATAKTLSGPGPEWEAEDYAAMLEDLAIIFPPAEEAAAGAGVEVVDEDDAVPSGRAGPRGREPAAEQPAASTAGGMLQRLGHVAARAGATLSWAVSAGCAWLAHAARAAGAGGGAPAQAVSAALPAASRFGHLPEVRPIFVTGLPRSGSTLIEQILSRWAPWAVCAACKAASGSA